MKFSLCMIVKDEEPRLEKCLSTLADVMDEIIIVDTGSSDNTKEIAGKFTDLIYDFSWTGDFSEARNFAASKATGDYIYTADADEYLEPEDQKKLCDLKKVLLPEVEIVQMWYCTPSELSTVYNFEEEYRPKLYKRLREFTWIDPIHETLRLDPVVFDSDIRIQHRPTPGHGKRDLDALAGVSREQGRLSDKLRHMYAMELFRCGDVEDFVKAEPCFREVSEQEDVGQDALREAICVLTRTYRLQGDTANFLAYALRDAVTNPTAELCCELGMYFEEQNNPEEAAMWYQNALSETESIIDIRTSGEIPEAGLMRCRREKR
ncbi:MAG: glycosyltransferase family 2 protein [Lachnospiraceae bacterium]|nr:glycosyltransferase family 2 protein [Lachnospiraceae bacterium]